MREIVGDIIFWAIMILILRYIKRLWRDWPVVGQYFEMRNVGKVYISHVDLVFVTFTHESSDGVENIRDTLFIPLFLHKSTPNVEKEL